MPNSDAGYVWGIDFSPDGVLYGAFGELMRIDLNSCQAYQVSPDFSLPWVNDIDWAPDGFIYAVDDETKKLYKIDPATGLIVDENGPYDSETWGVASQCLNGGSVATLQGLNKNTIAQSSRHSAMAGPTASELSDIEAAIEEERAMKEQKEKEMLEILAHQRAPEVQQRAVPEALLLADQATEGVTYDVLLDTVNPPNLLICSDLTEQECDPGVLDYCTTYYWQVVAKNTSGEAKDGPVWTFTTESVPADLDNDCDVDCDDLAIFLSYWMFGTEQFDPTKVPELSDLEPCFETNVGQ
jgi:hypothetical protein